MRFNLSQYYSLVLLLYVLVILAIIILPTAAATSARPVVVPVEEEDADTDVDANVDANDDEAENDEADNSSKDYWLMNNTTNNISLIIHRNGEIDPCGITGVITQDNFINNLLPPSSSSNKLKSKLNKYEIESRLTDNISKNLILTTTNDDDHDQKHNMDLCGPGDGRINNGAVINDDDDTDDDDDAFYKHCDRGPNYTPILLDHNKLVKTSKGGLPCRFYTREGLRITSFKQFTNLIIDHQQQQQQQQHSCANPQDDDDDGSSFEECKDNNKTNDENNNNVEYFHLYAVPAGRVFIFAPSYIGEIFELHHMKLLPDVVNKSITLEVLSITPKIFDILNIFTKNEANQIVQRALNEKSPSHKIKRSTTGSSSTSIIQKRTSENAFDTHSKVALELKKRIFELLGFDEYWNGHDDGLQVLRYNMTTAYVPHMDYISSPTKSIFDYRSQFKGGNRYATVLLYMTDMPKNNSGGETVFSKAWPSSNIDNVDERKSHSDALNELRQSGDAERAGIQEDSWEESMVATCRSRMAIRPYSGRAVLFYSQLPNGQPDRMSTHGGCPVLHGDKWAANLWVWNTPRQDFVGSPVRQDLIDAGYTENINPSTSTQAQKIKAIFKNSKQDPNMKDAVLYYDEAMYWGKLGFNDPPLHSDTYEGHRWNVKVNDIVVQSWVISKSKEQEFTI